MRLSERTRILANYSIHSNRSVGSNGIGERNMKTRGVIQPTPHDSPDQQVRWMLIEMHHYWWEVTGKKDIQSINRLTQEIRKEWIKERSRHR